LPAAPATSQEDHVLSYHGGPERSGNFVVRGLTFERARSVHLDAKFNARISGKVYAQPLYWGARDSSSGMLLIATEENKVYALDAATGSEIWSRSLGRPVARFSLRCGNIDPLGITGTPVIDESTGAIYLDAAIEDFAGPHHRIFALALKDGAPLTGGRSMSPMRCAPSGSTPATRMSVVRSPSWTASCLCPLAAITAIAAIITAGW
jgi:outer membrane protein assembly factor BamB